MSNFYVLIISLLIIPSYGNFINLKDDMEYDLLIKEHRTNTNPKGILTEDVSAESNLLLKTISDKKILSHFYKQKAPNEEEKYFDEPFITENNGSQLITFSFPHNVSYQEYASVQPMMKAVLGDRSDLVKLASAKEHKNETTMVNNLPYGYCESNVTITQDSETVTIKAKSIRKLCTFSDEIKKLWGPELLNLVDESSECFNIMIFERKNMNPTTFISYMTLNMNTDEGFDITTMKMTFELMSSKEMKIKDEIKGDWMTMTNEEILESMRVTMKKTIN